MFSSGSETASRHCLHTVDQVERALSARSSGAARRRIFINRWLGSRWMPPPLVDGSSSRFSLSSSAAAVSLGLPPAASAAPSPTSSIAVSRMEGVGCRLTSCTG